MAKKYTEDQLNTLDKSFLVTGPFWPFLRKDDRCGSDLLQGSRW